MSAKNWKVANMKKEKMELIFVVKHPRKKLFAFLDGHHRYYAYKELGLKYISSAQAGDYSKASFFILQNTAISNLVQW